MDGLDYEIMDELKEKKFTETQLRNLFYQTIAYMWDRRNKKTDMKPEEFLKQTINKI